MTLVAKGAVMARTCKVPMYNGQVACPDAPLGVTVDVELCYRCRRLKGFYDEESGTKAVCVAPPLARNLLAWLAPES